MSNSVLIITNDASDARILHDTLLKAKDGPFSNEWVRSLSAALTRLKQGGIDIILVDLDLPDSSDIATFDALFKSAPLTPVMTLSNEDDEALAVAAVERGAQGFLVKGYFHTALVPQALRNIIHRKRVEDALFVEKERARVTLESIGDGVISTDVSAVVTYLNAEAERLTGWSREKAIGRPVTEILNLVDGETTQPIRSPIELVIQQEKSMALYANSVLIRQDGSQSPIEDSVAPIFDRTGKVTGAVLTFRDTSEMRAMVHQMVYLAQHDYLTGLPNRLLLNDRLSQAIAYAKRHGTGFALLYLDLDNFKHVNDSLGHFVGDLLLKSVAERLVSQVRHSDTVSRQGGDEFVILVLENEQAEDARLTAEKVIRSLAKPHVLQGHEIHATTSIGISMFPSDGESAETLVKSADIAMYWAKEKGRSNYQFFKEEMNARAVQRQSIETDLRRAIDNNEFVLHYQPKINLRTGNITGAEALVRWNHPHKGLLLPNAFIPVAEECGLIVPIGQIVLRQACAQAQAWFDSGMRPISIAINISAIELKSGNFLECLCKILDDTGLDATCLELELTETALMQNIDSSRAILQALKSKGLQLAVDDFGTGYSSLSYLSQFPIDVLKIDKSFVQNISTRTDDEFIVHAVISMGNSLKQKVIAEGVETAAQLAFLHAHECEQGQGNFFSLPLPACEFLKMFNGSKHVP